MTDRIQPFELEVPALRGRLVRLGPLFQTMNIQDVGGLRKTVELGIRKIEAMLPLANEARREECPASELMVALQCGGSDAWSGITANPGLGHASDLIVAAGGTTVLAVMHDLNLAALYCERLLFLRAGEVYADGPTAEVFTAEVITAVYDTPVEVALHPATGKPHAVFLPRNS